MRMIIRIFVATILTTLLGTVAFAIHHKDQEKFRFLRAGQKIDVSALSNLGSSGPK